MMWQLTHALGSVFRYENPLAYTNVYTPIPAAIPHAMASTQGSMLPLERDSFDPSDGRPPAPGLSVLPAPDFPCKAPVFLLCVGLVNTGRAGGRTAPGRVWLAHDGPAAMPNVPALRTWRVGGVVSVWGWSGWAYAARIARVRGVMRVGFGV